MDAINEKKWFVYLGDRHEGPYSLEEIEGKMDGGQVSSATYVWAEGMPDWKSMKEVSDFGSLLARGAAPRSSAPAESEESDTGSVLLHPAESGAPTPTAAAADDGSPNLVEGAEAPRKSRRGRIFFALLLVVVAGSLVVLRQSGRLDRLRGHPLIRSLLASAGDAIRPATLQLTDRAPWLAPLFSPLPELKDVVAPEYGELQEAARAPAESPVFALALATSDILNPAFYVAARVEDGKRLRVRVTGVPDTLLNHVSFENEAPVTIDKRWGKSEPVRFPDGKPLPRGEYWVSVLDSGPAGSGEQKLLVKKQYFLGGPKDATYSERLEEYHSKLKAKAQAELVELKQFVSTLELQLASTTVGFGKYRVQGGEQGRGQGKIPGKARLKAWKELDEKWSQLDSQLAATFGKWTPEAVVKDFFFSPVYILVRQAAEAVTAVHVAHRALISPEGSPGGGGIAQGEAPLGPEEAATKASQALAQLKAKIEQAEKLPPSAKGLPSREGL
jgi:hypothetical protein